MWKRVVGWLLSVAAGILVLLIPVGASSEVHWGWSAGMFGLPALLFLSTGVALLASPAGPIAKPAKWFAIVYGSLIVLLVILSVALPHQMAYQLGRAIGSATPASADPAPKATEYMQKGEYAKAMTELDAAIVRTQKHDERALLMEKRTRASLAARDYRQAWQDFCVTNAFFWPMSPGAERLSEMRAVLPQVTGVPVDGQGNNAFAYAALASEAQDASNFAKAKGYFDKAITLAPNDRIKGVFLYQRAYYKHMNKDAAGTLADYEEACRLAPVLNCRDSFIKMLIEGKSSPTK